MADGKTQASSLRLTPRLQQHGDRRGVELGQRRRIDDKRRVGPRLGQCRLQLGQRLGRLCDGQFGRELHGTSTR
jgi:hypothetical protein